jgi:alpha-D-ribose 1-methylphosphonate 5-triphosphate synthase subunit PhnH
MNPFDLNALARGFDHESLDSQAVFRVALHALSHPGLPLDMPLCAGAPKQGHLTAAHLLLGLLDADTPVWLSPVLAASDAAFWLRFHTGCTLVSDPAQAQFCWMAQGDAWPLLSELRLGTDVRPDVSATCVIEVDRLEGDAPGWVLQGPGIDGLRRLRVSGLRNDFEAQWQATQSRFPCGVDVFFASPTKIAGLPRTTRLELMNRG